MVYSFHCLHAISVRNCNPSGSPAGPKRTTSGTAHLEDFAIRYVFSQLGPTFQYAMFFRRWIQVSEEHFDMPCSPEGDFRRWKYEHRHGQEGVSETGRSRQFLFSEMFSRGCVPTVGEHSETYEHPHGQEGVSETGLSQSYSDEKHLPK